MIPLTGPDHINPAQWHQSLGYARQACARIFRDGGTPRDAILAFGLASHTAKDWSKAVELIAEVLCAQPVRKAA
jgi:hypothetical protein